MRTDDVIVGFDVCARVHVDVDVRHINRVTIDPLPTATPRYLGGPAEHLAEAITACHDPELTWPICAELTRRPAMFAEPEEDGLSSRHHTDRGANAVLAAARDTSLHIAEPAGAAVVGALACIAHFCNRLGLDPIAAFEDALCSYADHDEDDFDARPVPDGDRRAPASAEGRTP